MAYGLKASSCHPLNRCPDKLKIIYITLNQENLWLWAFLDIDENIQKIIKKTIKIQPFLNVIHVLNDYF